jgi:hypothetical protein
MNFGQRPHLFKPCPLTDDAWMLPRFKWTRTWPDIEHDGVATDETGRRIGRVYRHPDRSRWQWCSWTAPGNPIGICDTKEQAMDEVERRA